MQSVGKIFDYRQKSENGFAIIAALMAVMILMAVGFFSLTVTGQDVLISSRLVGERKAFSAAEAGMHKVCWLLNPFLPLANFGLPVVGIPQSIDSVRDPSITYEITSPPAFLYTINLYGFDMSKAYTGNVYGTRITGKDASYNSSVSIDIGTVYSPNPGDTQQGQL